MAESHAGSSPAKSTAYDDLAALPTSRSLPEDPKHPMFPIALGACVALAILIAAASDPQPAPKPAETAEAPAETAEAPKPAEPAPSEAPSLKTEVEGLAAQIKDLKGKIASSADVASLQTKVNELAKSTEGVALLPKKLGTIEDHVTSLDKAITGLRGDLSSLKEQIKGTAPSAPAPKSETVSAATLAPAAALFSQEKYKDAGEAFRKLTETYPDDARAWYYAALANALVGGQWTSAETVRLVEKGVEREKAGTPKSADIDATFKDLKEHTGAKWLAYYRKMAKP